MKKLLLQVPLVIAGTFLLIRQLVSRAPCTRSRPVVWRTVATIGKLPNRLVATRFKSAVAAGLKPGGGGAWLSADYPMMASLVANYQFDSRAGSNANAKFTRVPLDAMMYYTGLDKLRFGVGLSYIVSPTVKAVVDENEQSIKFKNATGKSFEIGYEVAPNMWTNLRLSSERFKPKTTGAAQDAAVSHLSVNLSSLF